MKIPKDVSVVDNTKSIIIPLNCQIPVSQLDKYKSIPHILIMSTESVLVYILGLSCEAIISEHEIKFSNNKFFAFTEMDHPYMRITEHICKNANEVWQDMDILYQLFTDVAFLGGQDYGIGKNIRISPWDFNQKDRE